MIRHLDLGATRGERKAKIGPLIRSGEIKLAGYQKGKISGTLTCSAGKRMKVENRVFFRDEKEAQSGLSSLRAMYARQVQAVEGEAVRCPVGSAIRRIPAVVA